MAKQKPKEEQQAPKKYDYITKITVAGFKSIAEEQSVEIRPLTILAGANSSGFLCEVAKKGTKLLWLPLSNRLRTRSTNAHYACSMLQSPLLQEAVSASYTLKREKS